MSIIGGDFAFGDEGGVVGSVEDPVDEDVFLPVGVGFAMQVALELLVAPAVFEKGPLDLRVDNSLEATGDAGSHGDATFRGWTQILGDKAYVDKLLPIGQCHVAGRSIMARVAFDFVNSALVYYLWLAAAALGIVMTLNVIVL